MITEENTDLENEINYEVVTLAECDYKYRNHKKHSVCYAGKLLGFEEEE